MPAPPTSGLAGNLFRDPTHAQREAHSSRLLEGARATAAKEHKYSSARTRSRLISTFSEACGGKVPFDWQVNVAEALLLGLDIVLTAGTGAGKTMPFVMPLLLNKTEKKMVIIISPLNELERDQVSTSALRLRAPMNNTLTYYARRADFARWVLLPPP